MSTSFIDFGQLKERLTIHQAAQYLGIMAPEKNGSIRVPCPACRSGGDRALAITPAKGLFYCFAAKEGGDLIKLVAHVKGCGQKEAAQMLDEHYGVSILPTAKSEPTASKPLQTGFDPEEYLKRLDPANSALSVLGIAPDTFKAFGAGYAATGLLRGRLALPMRDTQGKILGFCGRALDDKEPRYIFPKNFQPSSVAFNWDKVGPTDFVYLCTDPVDVLKAHEGGIDNAVAALGSIDATFLQVLSLWMEEHHIAAIEPM